MPTHDQAVDPCSAAAVVPSTIVRRWRTGRDQSPKRCAWHCRQDPDRHLRAWACPGPYCPGWPGVAGWLQGHPTTGGTQDRPPYAPPTRRQAGPSPRTDQGRRLLTASCRGQPGPVRRARTHPSIRARWVVAPIW